MKKALGWIGLATFVLHQAFTGALSGRAAEQLEPKEVSLDGPAYHLSFDLHQGLVQARLQDKVLGLTLSDGPYYYFAQTAKEQKQMSCCGLQDAKISRSGREVLVRGKLAGLDLENRFALLPRSGFMEERVVLRNRTTHMISLAAFEAGFVRRVSDPRGQALAELARDRWVAVPFRRRAYDPKGFANDFSIQELIDLPGGDPRMDDHQQYAPVPSPNRHSEGWAWTHGDNALGIFAFNQENMLFSVVSKHKNDGIVSLRFGGACMLAGEPAALTRIAPGQTVDLGTIRYESMKGGYNETALAFRSWLDEKGCRFPRNYDPPVHWEQLYDMEGAWFHRLTNYTKAALEKEARKAVDFQCQALYLDPGWDTTFGSFLWGQDWLGPRREFVEEMKTKYGLKVSLHCPLASWISTLYAMGPSAIKDWPDAARRVPTIAEPPIDKQRRVPAQREARRNLALLPVAQASASSVLSGATIPSHQIAHLNDGWYGNSASWIPEALPAWVEVDLGSSFKISEVVLGNDHPGELVDRAPTALRILAATNYAADSSAPVWRVLTNYEGEGILKEKAFMFEPVPARWVRVELLKSDKGLPRLDEIEVYEAEAVSQEQAYAFDALAKRGPEPPNEKAGPKLCLGSRQYLDEATKRLLANCADGARFLMFDGNWWNGGCINPEHGHPVPYCYEDHVRANLDLVRRVHAKYPKVLIELHDCVAGGSPVRFTPVYYKYGLPGSYDENWGFELMWDPMADLKEQRAQALYYYNLGCNVPVYLHIDLRKDNEQCIVFWWYASTCRHLGIGGTNAKTAVVEAQKKAMRQYRKLDRFYKRGEFIGINENIHLHVLPRENAFVVNVFNPSDEPRTIEGTIDLRKLGLRSNKPYRGSSPWGIVEDRKFKVRLKMEPWSAQLADFKEQ